MPHPVTDQQGQFSAEPANLGAIAHTGNNLGATQPANSTPPGFESAAASFSRPIEQPTALIEGAQRTGPVDEAEMLDDGDRQGHTATEGSNPQTDTQHPSTSAGQQSVNLGATGQPVPAISFDPNAIANLLQAASVGHFWDVPEQLKGATADQCRNCMRYCKRWLPTRSQLNLIRIRMNLGRKARASRCAVLQGV